MHCCIGMTDRWVDDAAHQDSAILTIFGETQLWDNLWHTRKFLQAMSIHLGLKEYPNVLSKLETELLCIFGIVRSGASDPLPWVFVVDDVLRSMWQTISSIQKPTEFTKQLFNEIVLFSQGTAINCYLARFKMTKIDTKRIIVSISSIF